MDVRMHMGFCFYCTALVYTGYPVHTCPAREQRITEVIAEYYLSKRTAELSAQQPPAGETK